MLLVKLSKALFSCFFLLSVKSHADLSMRWWKGSIVKLIVRNCILKEEYRSLSVFWKRRQCEDVPYLLLDVMLHHRHTKHVHGQLIETFVHELRQSYYKVVQLKYEFSVSENLKEHLVYSLIRSHRGRIISAWFLTFITKIHYTSKFTLRVI